MLGGIKGGEIKMKPVYKCDYCYTLLPEDECRIHEPECYYNPKNKACYSCKNAEY